MFEVQRLGGCLHSAPAPATLALLTAREGYWHLFWNLSHPWALMLTQGMPNPPIHQSTNPPVAWAVRLETKQTKNLMSIAQWLCDRHGDPCPRLHRAFPVPQFPLPCHPPPEKRSLEESGIVYEPLRGGVSHRGPSPKSLGGQG